MITKKVIINNISLLAVNKWLTRLTNTVFNNNKNDNHLSTRAND